MTAPPPPGRGAPGAPAGGGGPDGALDRFLRILSAFDAAHPALTVAELARRAALPLPTAYRWVDRLMRAELLERDGEGRVHPGLRLWELASRSAPTVPLARAAMPFLVDVQAVLRQNTQLAVLDEDGVLVLERLAARDAVVNRAAVAERLPAFTTSLGLVLLAFARPVEAARFVDRHRDRLGRPVDPALPQEAGAPASAGGRPAVTAPTEEGLRTLLAQVRRDGYAAVDGAVDPEARGIAAPVHRGRGLSPAALGVVVHREDPVTPGVPPLLMTAARGISRALGADPQ